MRPIGREVACEEEELACDLLGRTNKMAGTEPGHFQISDQAKRYWAAWDFAACRSASLRNAITETLRVR
jgi:hypothetical protein